MLVVNKERLKDNPLLANQWREICEIRANFAMQGKRIANAIEFDPQFWTRIDRDTMQLIEARQGQNAFLADAMSVSKSVPIGMIANIYRRYGAEFEAQSSLDGNHSKPVTGSQYDYDGSLVPIHTSSFKLAWREYEGMKEAGMSSLEDDQQSSVRAVRKKLIDSFMFGTQDLYKGVKNYGIANSPNTLAIDLGATGHNFDFTDTSAAYADIYNALTRVLNELYGRNNQAEGEITLYVSGEIYENWERLRDAIHTDGSILSSIMKMSKIKNVVKLHELENNEMLGVIWDRQYVQMLVGMPLSTVPIERKTPMDNYQFLTWTAAGLQIRGDYNNRGGAFYAAS